VLKLKLDQMIKDTLANIKLQSTPQPAALTTTATMATMSMTTPPVHPLCHHDPVDLMDIHRVKEPKHTQLSTPSPTITGNNNDAMTNNATPSQVTSLMMIMMVPMTQPTVMPTPSHTNSASDQSITDCNLCTTDCVAPQACAPLGGKACDAHQMHQHPPADNDHQPADCHG